MSKYITEKLAERVDFPITPTEIAEVDKLLLDYREEIPETMRRIYKYIDNPDSIKDELYLLSVNLHSTGFFS
jgi:hypothetical protein